MEKSESPVGKGEELRRQMTDATFRGAVKRSTSHPVENALPDRLQELLKLMDEAENKAARKN